MGERSAQQEENEPDDAHIDDHEGRESLQGLAHPVETPRAPVLPEHRADGAGQGEQAAKGHGRDPVDDGGGGDGLIAELRHDAGEESIGGGRGDVGQNGRNRDGEEGPRVAGNRLPTRARQKICARVK